MIESSLTHDEPPVAGRAPVSTFLITDIEGSTRLWEEHVAVIPGTAFGPSGEGHVRACYATSYEQLEEALRRIGRFVERTRAA